ncbi:DNA/RNA non-specific endonuclease [Microbacterium sp. A93]|uniref:DNA/RNA non-specific endonuclease n=1 Tax=Microbacterium sp. A93 TaxID=3450716 RepID=UPI003F422F19
MADGYNPEFLATPLPLPRPARDVQTLPYPRFSVLLDSERKLAAVTAVNIDGATLREVPRTGQWRLDPRVDNDAQAGPDVYARNDLDRGHLVRRRDPGWGTANEAREATEATFFYPNAAPQAAGFNQSKKLWLGLEDHVLAYAEATDQRLSVFTAPVLQDEDPAYRGIRIPRLFWKIAAWQGPSGLEAAGFLLDQSELIDIRDEVRTIPPLAAFRTFQVSVAVIADITGIEFGPLPDADVFPEQKVGARTWSALQTTRDIVL